MERWLPVVGFEGLYEVSDLGRVRSLDREHIQASRWGGTRMVKRHGRILRPGRTKSGHLTVALGAGNSHAVHKLVLRAFDGAPPVGFEARHRDGVPHNNVLDNLIWSARADNNRDRKWHKGTKLYKLSPDNIRNIRLLLIDAKLTQKQIAQQFDICPSLVSAIRNGRLHGDVSL